MKELDIKKLVMDLLKNKNSILDQLGVDLVYCADTMDGIKKILPSVVDGSEENLRHQLKNALAINFKLAEMLKRLNLLMLIWVGSDEFDATVGKLAVKMGIGEEALREMFKQKKRGK